MSEEKVQRIHRILSLITGKEPKTFEEIEDECATDWSNALKPYGWKLAYCDSKLDYIIENLSSFDEDGKYIVEVCTDGGWELGQKLLRKDQTGEEYALNKDFRLVEVAGDFMKISDSTFDSDDFVLRIFRVVPANYPKEI